MGRPMPGCTAAPAVPPSPVAAAAAVRAWPMVSYSRAVVLVEVDAIRAMSWRSRELRSRALPGVTKQRRGRSLRSGQGMAMRMRPRGKARCTKAKASRPLSGMAVQPCQASAWLGATT